MVTLGIAGQSLDSMQSNMVIFTIEPQPLPAPHITLAGSVVSWVGVSRASGYSIRVGGNHVTGDLGPAARSFDLANLALGVGDHTVTVGALGVSWQSLNSMPSNAVTFTIEPGYQTISFGPDIQAEIIGPTISLGVGQAGTSRITLLDPEQFDTGSIRWFLDGIQITGATVSGSHGQTLTLFPITHNNMIGTHRVTVEVRSGGVLHSRIIVFSVVL